MRIIKSYQFWSEQIKYGVRPPKYLSAITYAQVGQMPEEYQYLFRNPKTRILIGTQHSGLWSVPDFVKCQVRLIDKCHAKLILFHKRANGGEPSAWVTSNNCECSAWMNVFDKTDYNTAKFVFDCLWEKARKATSTPKYNLEELRS